MHEIEARLIHDLRNAVLVINGAAHHLAREGAGPASGHLVDMIKRRSEMVMSLLNDLTTMHTLDRNDLALAVRRVDLGPFLADLADGRMHDTGLSIQVTPGGDLAVLADPVRFGQIVDNLVSNAGRYGGNELTISAFAADHEVWLDFHDNGAGLDPALGPHVFDAYAAGPDSAVLGGMGLGLSIVKELCTVMGGRVEFVSGPGTTFRVVLPRCPDVSVGLPADVAPAGHSVTFWSDASDLTDGIVGYIAHGLVAGEAVLIAVTEEHRQLIDEGLEVLGLDVPRLLETGQYLPISATDVHRQLPVGGRIDRGRFDAIVGAAVRDTKRRWAGLRAFGEIVDVYWRAGDGALAIELEACWNALRAEIAFPLLCAYELSSAAGLDSVCDCHDAVVCA